MLAMCRSCIDSTLVDDCWSRISCSLVAVPLFSDFPCHRPVHVFISWENVPILSEAITMISDSSGLCTLNSAKIMGASILDINKLN